MRDIIHIPSPNFNERPEGATAKFIILHYTEMSPVEAAIERLCDRQAKVSAHYVIGEKGQIYNLVDPQYRAWHAGISSFQGIDNINDVSIGIELDHPGHKNPKSYSNGLMKALLELLHFLCDKYRIDPKQIWGHSDIAPYRKIDPGAFFDWHFLWQNGFGTWFCENSDFDKNVDLEKSKKMLQSLGYFIDNNQDIKPILTAFQRHFYPKNVTGQLDHETYRRLGAFLSK